MIVTTQDKLKCALRELGYRKRVYKRQVDAGKMSPQMASHEIACMEAIVEDYRQLTKQDELPLGGDAA
jgi:hypothetical protein